MAHVRQMLCIFVSFPLDAIPGFGTAGSIEDVFSNQWQAMRCLARQNVPECPLCDCSNAWWNYILFIVGYIMSNFFQIGLIKYCGATFSYVVSTIVTPVSAFAFAWRALLGDNAQPMTFWVYISLAVLVVGMVMYRWAGEPLKPNEDIHKPIRVGETPIITSAQTTATMTGTPLRTRPHGKSYQSTSAAPPEPDPISGNANATTSTPAAAMVNTVGASENERIAVKSANTDFADANADAQQHSGAAVPVGSHRSAVAILDD